MATWKNAQRHGNEPRIKDIENLTFNDPLFDGDPEAIKDKTFEELQDQAWTKDARNTSAFTNDTRNTSVFTSDPRN